MALLSDSDTARQDFVDNEIFTLTELVWPASAGSPEMEWDIELIGGIRDLIGNWFLDHGVIESLDQFYPGLDHELDKE